MTLTTPFIPGTKFGTSSDVGGNHAEHVIPGDVNSSGTWVAGLPQSENIIGATMRQICAWATASYGHRAFASTTDEVTVSGNSPAATTWVAAFVNPVGSGRTAHIDRIICNNEVRGVFRRFRDASTTSLGTPQAEVNMGGGATAAVCELYAQGQFTAPTTGLALAHSAFQPADAHDQDEMHGMIIVRPGQSLHWTFQNRTGNGLAGVGLYWWEEDVV